jgi:ketosteroid isomerase-like protein
METDKQILLKIDREFSEMSKAKGSLEAFYTYMAFDGIVLPKKGLPIRKDVYEDALRQQESGKQTTILTWEPLLADISKSADLGYTHGKYKLIKIGQSGTQDTTYGYYITVWKRQSDGNWKFVFDTGNEIEDK